MKRRILIVNWIVVLTFLPVGALSAAEIVDPAKLAALARPLVDGGWANGLAIGLVGEQGTQFVGYGRASDKQSGAPDANTIFEIGSVSKVFTGLLLAEMVEDHTVQLDEPVQKLLGESMTVPKQGEREITLVDLATHTSGLPYMPSNLKPRDLSNPFADYTVEQLGKFVSNYKLKRGIGSKAEYSNLGVGLLGHALALKAGTSYEALVRKRICEPLGMDDTTIALNDSQQARLAQGHDADGDPAANWDIPTLAGAGAIRSSVNDMLKFVAANLALTKTPLAAAIAASHVVHFKDPARGDDTALVWQVRRDNGVIWHNGQTGAYHSFAGFSPEKRVGVVILCNTTTRSVDALGFLSLQLATTGKAEPLKLAKPIELTAEALEPLVGKYQLSPLATLTVTRKGDQLLAQLTGQEKFKLYPESKTRFFYRVVEAAITFEAGDDGAIKQLVLHQNGRNLPAPKQKDAG